MAMQIKKHKEKSEEANTTQPKLPEAVLMGRVPTQQNIMLPLLPNKPEFTYIIIPM
jgi:hypothetical protein